PHILQSKLCNLIQLDLLDLNSTLATLTPTHREIVDVVESLFRAFKQDHRSPEAAGGEILRPIRAVPFTSAPRLTRQLPPLSTGRAFASLPLLREIHLLQLPQALAKVLNPPQP